MAKKPIEIDVLLNAEDSIQKAKDLKRALREIPVGTEDYDKVFNAIDDLDDKLKGAKKGAADWIDTLEGAGGPIGLLGTGLNKVKVSFSSFNSALKASVIGLIVTAVGGLVAAFAKSETATKKLQPLLTGLEKIFNGIYRAVEPLFEVFLELAETALPYITEYIGIFYSSLVSLFTLVKELGVGVGKILKGIFTLDWDAVSEGYEQITGSWDKAVKSFTETNKRYNSGVKERTKGEKEAAESATKTREEQLEAAKKIADANLELRKQQALKEAKTEQERFEIEKKFADEKYKLDLDNLNERAKLYGKNSKERKDIEAQLTALEADRIAREIENRKKEEEFRQQDITKRLEEIKNAGQQEVEAQQKILELKKQLYGNESAEADIAAQNVINSRKKANEEEMKFLDDLVKAGGTLTQEQKKRREELNNINKGIIQDQAGLDLQIIKNTEKRNEKLNDLEVEKLKKISENERLSYDIRIAALQKLQQELRNDANIKLNALDAEYAARVKAGEDEIAVARYVAEQKKLIEQGLADQVEPLKLQSIALTQEKNRTEIEGYIAIGNAVAQATNLFEEGSQAAKTFAAIQDLVNIAQQANIIITNLQTLGLLQKASAESIATTATMGHATAEGVKQGAKNPFPANLIAIASIVGAIISIFATIKKLFGAKGDISKNQPTNPTQTPQPYRVSANRAMGGLVSGEGSSTSDSIITGLSNGEFVMNANSTRRFLPILERMNEFGRMPQFTEQSYSSIFPDRTIPTNTGSSVPTMMPIRTYVVSQDMTNEQQFERVIKSRSLL